LTEQDLAEAKSLMKQVSVIPEALLFAELGATAMHDVTRGGLLETLLEIALLSDVEIQVNYEQIPIPPVAERFAMAFGYDPMKMISSGTLAASIPQERLDEVAQALDRAGILFADIGTVQEGQGVKIFREGEMAEYVVVHPEADELARMWVDYVPDTEN